ncbi:hypothetical protein OZ410_07570 [Robiginitalea sp. M366]|uniref:hypothetical protein n=1 Tax=Robiginitalea aestuariiviva TaxID=3036903 RepID=UPI00240E4498|nr:hypothetical protein [Robiginitalea aestuariiviva]MDG1572171.1 hypothetical protein [Robiginitalea aestuariiviva]
MNSRIPVLLLCFFLGLVASAQDTLPLFQTLRLGMTSDMVYNHLKSQDLEPVIFHPEHVQFPLASSREEHWQVAGYTTQGHSLQQMALVFADGKLAFLQARGGVNTWMDARPEANFGSYSGYRFYEGWGAVSHPDSDQLWLLSPEGLHLNLFAWNHPLLEAGAAWPAYPKTVSVPHYLKMGATLQQLEPMLESVSTQIIREELDGSDPNAQLQLNCYGIPYAGFARKAEARFGGGNLNVVWILTAKAEESRVREQLRLQYGPPDFTSEAWEAYHNWQVFLRKDKPEVLFLTPELGQFYKKEYFGQ